VNTLYTKLRGLYKAKYKLENIRASTSCTQIVVAKRY
jgi:hypothetical protein